MIKNLFKGTYSTQVGRKVGNLVEEMLRKHIGNQYVCRKKIFDRNIDFVISNLQKSQILIEDSYMVPTGSGQSTKLETMINVVKEVINRNMHDNDNMIFINLLMVQAGLLAKRL